MKRALATGADLCVRVVFAVLAVLLLAVLCLSLVNVAGRYLLGRSVLWSDEVNVYAMIGLTWLGAAAGMWRRAEIRIDILADGLPAGPRRWLAFGTDLTSAGVCGYAAWLSVGYVLRLHRIGMVSDMAGLPLWIVHGMLPLSLGCMTLVFLLRAMTGPVRNARAEALP